MSTYDDRPASPSATGRSQTRHHPYDDRAGDTGDYTDSSSYSDTAVIERDSDRDGIDDTRATTAERLGWTASADFGLLLMRLVIGGIFMAHGSQKVFGWFGGVGLDGFAEQLDGFGFTETDVLAALTGFTELVGGALVVLGLFTPLAAAGLLGVAINVIWLKWNEGLFIIDDGFEGELALAAIAVGLIFAGPGRIALDNGRAWFRHPMLTGWFCVLLGAGAAVAIRLLFHGG